MSKQQMSNLRAYDLQKGSVTVQKVAGNGAGQRNPRETSQQAKEVVLDEATLTT